MSHCFAVFAISFFVFSSAAISCSAGGNPYLFGPRAADGSIIILQSLVSTYVAIERTPSESDAIGTTFIIYRACKHLNKIKTYPC